MNKKILVIDDDSDIRKSFLLALEDTPYDVDAAASGMEGVEMEEKKQYDLIFLDLKMPNMNGTEVLRTIRKRNKVTPIFIVTAFYKEFLDELRNIDKEESPYSLLRKPIDMDQICLVVKGVLDGPISF